MKCKLRVGKNYVKKMVPKNVPPAKGHGMTAQAWKHASLWETDGWSRGLTGGDTHMLNIPSRLPTVRHKLTERCLASTPFNLFFPCISESS